jgi:Holliday junction resolvase RusA-like endonuclease
MIVQAFGSVIVLPWPPASLSGHANGHWRTKAAITRKYRETALYATKAVKPSVPATGDILVTIEFVPPNRRSDRANYPNRVKAYLDGIAEALGVNDRRFLPSYIFRDPEHRSSPGCVIITLEAAQ